jgi:serine O-acetyltransferase
MLAEQISADRDAYGLTSTVQLLASLTWLSPFWLVLLYRLGRWLHVRGVRGAPNVLRAVGLVLWSAEIWAGAEVGPGLRIAHSSGIVVGDGVKAGRNLRLFSGVVLGSSPRSSASGSCEPLIGDDVTVFANAVVAGGISVGDGATIRAGAVVLTDVAAGERR